jgi:hypothetical protein
VEFEHGVARRNGIGAVHLNLVIALRANNRGKGRDERAKR